MQDTAVCSEPVSQASRATMGLSFGTCRDLPGPVHGRVWPVQRRLRCAHEQDLPAHGRALRVHGRAGPLYGLSMY